jgi:hypothetical protein
MIGKIDFWINVSVTKLIQSLLEKLKGASSYVTVISVQLDANFSVIPVPSIKNIATKVYRILLGSTLFKKIETTTIALQSKKTKQISHWYLRKLQGDNNFVELLQNTQVCMFGDIE